MATTCDINGKKPEISYPCDWSYKLIVLKGEDIKTLLKELMGGEKYTLKLSNESKGGKYESYNLSLRVNSEEQRESYFKTFKKHKQIKFVL